MSVLSSHRVSTFGSRNHQPIMFSHGFATDQSMWQFLVPAFVDMHRVVMFDHLCEGRPGHANPGDGAYSSLERYSTGVLEICTALDLHDIVFVGHSVGGVVGMLAANADPDRFAGLVLINSSPRFLNDVGYDGGYSEVDVTDMIDSMEGNPVGWSAFIPPGSARDTDRTDFSPDRSGRLARTDQRTAWQFARATFLSDHRADVAKVSVPTLILQFSFDPVVPRSVGEYLSRSIPGSRLEMITAAGHFPNLGAPDQVIAALRRFVKTLPRP